jgi:O-antigen/teichoic acid export membrane protein
MGQFASLFSPEENGENAVYAAFSEEWNEPKTLTKRTREIWIKLCPCVCLPLLGFDVLWIFGSKYASLWPIVKLICIAGK